MLEERSKSAKLALSSGTVALSYATKAAKILVGQIPGPPLDDPAIYANGIAHALAGPLTLPVYARTRQVIHGIV